MVSHFKTFFALFTVFVFNSCVSASPATTVTLYNIAPGDDDTTDQPSVSLSVLGVNADGATTYLYVESETITVPNLATDAPSSDPSITETFTVEATIVADATHFVYSYSHPSPTPSALVNIGPVVEDCQIDLANNEGVCVDNAFMPSTTVVDTISGPLVPFATLVAETGLAFASASASSSGSRGSQGSSAATPTGNSNGASRVAAGSLTSVAFLLGMCLVF